MTENLDEMSPEELQAYEEKLNKELKLRELKKKQADLQEQKDKETQEAKEQLEKQYKEDALKKIYEEHPDWQPKDLLQPGHETKGNQESENKVAVFYKNYRQRHADVETGSTYINKYEDLKNERFQIYRNQRWEECGMDGLWENTNSDTGCDDNVSDWSPDDIYAKVIWETFVCTADLMKICVKGISINPGDGLGVQIRAYGAFGDPTSLGACECASCASISFTTYSLTLKQYNLEAIVCDKDIWDVGSILMDAYMKALSDSWAQWFDKQIYSELETATPGTTETLVAGLSCTPSISGSCCTDASLVNLYNAVHNLVASMREGTIPYKPDYAIISPTVASIFKRMQTPTPMPWMGDIVFDEDGRLKKIAGLKVIEYCGANTCTDATGQEMVIVIDSRRAVGCVFGQQPRTYKFFQTNCNSYRIDQWAYVAFGELDTNAIGHVVNP